MYIGAKGFKRFLSYHTLRLDILKPRFPQNAHFLLYSGGTAIFYKEGVDVGSCASL